MPVVYEGPSCGLIRAGDALLDQEEVIDLGVDLGIREVAPPWDVPGIAEHPFLENILNTRSFKMRRRRQANHGRGHDAQVFYCQ